MKLFLLILGIGVGLPSHAQVLATVGGAKIMTEEFNRKLDEIRKQAMNPPTADQFLEDLVRFEIGVQEAEKAKLQNEPAVKDRYRQILYSALLEMRLGKKIEDIKITENEMRDHYKTAPELRLAHILIEVKENANPNDRQVAHKRAQEILAEVKKSKRPFEELVRLHTEDLSTKETGGDIGLQSKVTLSPQIYDTAMKMKQGEVNGLIETPLGFHIIKVLEKRPYDLADKRQLRAAIFDGKRAKIFNDYFDDLKKNYKVEINRDALKSLKSQ